MDEGPRVDALATRASTGDRGAQEALLVALDPLAWKLSYQALRRFDGGAGSDFAAFDKEDVYQEVRLLLWRLMPAYEASRGPAVPFFLHNTRRRLWDSVLPTRRWRPVAPLSLDRRAVPDRTLSPAAEGEALPDELGDHLRALTPLRRRVLYCAYGLDLDDAGVAARLGTTYRAAKDARYRALTVLRQRMQGASS